MHIPPPPFNPPTGLRNKHLQTILSSVGPRRIRLRKIKRSLQASAQQVIVDAGEGVRLLSYLNQPSHKERSEGLVVLIHGWEGSDESSYMLSSASRLLSEGYSVLRLNMRDHGASHHLNEEAFNSTLLDELIGGLKSIQDSLSYPYFHLAGFSLGGNFALRVASKAGDHDLKIKSVSAFCPVVHASEANAALVDPKNWLYNYYFVRKWKRSLHLKSKYFPDRYAIDDFAHLKSLDEMNQVLIPKYAKFQKLDEYFDAYAIVDDRLHTSNCPCYLHFAQDDMIIPIEGVARINKHDSLQIEISEHGGHCGFLTNWRFDSWQDERLLQIVRSHGNDLE